MLVMCLCTGLSLVLQLCATPCHVVELLVLCVFLLFVYGPSLRAGRGIVPCSNVLVMDSSRRGCNAECNLLPRFLVGFVVL